MLLKIREPKDRCRFQVHMLVSKLTIKLGSFYKRVASFCHIISLQKSEHMEKSLVFYWAITRLGTCYKISDNTKSTNAYISRIMSCASLLKTHVTQIVLLSRAYLDIFSLLVGAPQVFLYICVCIVIDALSFLIIHQ